MQNRKHPLIPDPSKILLIVSIPIVAILLVWQIVYTTVMQPSSKPLGEVQAPSGQPGRWDLIFYDNFESQNLDANKWTTCYWWDKQGCTNEGTKELEWYRPENITQQDGVMNLTARKQKFQASDGKTYDYTSGIVTTGRNVDDTGIPSRFAFQYGYVEVRAKIPSGQGLWPALWLLPADHISKPEIDIMEVLGHRPDTVEMNFHYRDLAGNRQISEGEWKGADLSQDWHTYAVNWQPEKITWYIDGVERRSFSDKTMIPSEPMYLIMNLAVGGDWPGPPDANTSFPATFAIDYVRIWKQAGLVSLLPVADTFVDASAPEKNFGEARTLEADGDPVRVAYLKFDLQALRGKKISSALLRVRTTGDGSSGSANSQAVYLTGSDWSENKLTDRNKPPIQGSIIGLLNKSEANVVYDIPLEPRVIQAYTGKLLSLGLVGKGHDGIYITSREFRPLYPELILTLDDSAQNWRQTFFQTLISWISN